MAGEPKPFDAAVVRYRHDPATGEFVNIGVILVSRDRSVVEAKFLGDWGRVFSAFPGANAVTLDAIRRTVATGLPQALAVHSGFAEALRAVFPPDDSGVEFSAPISGASKDLGRVALHLFRRQVAFHLPPTVEWIEQLGSELLANVQATPARMSASPPAVQNVQVHSQSVERARVGVR